MGCGWSPITFWGRGATASMPIGMLRPRGPRQRPPRTVHAWSTGIVCGPPNDFCGDAHGLGWCAPVYGQLVPSLTFRFSQTAQAPASTITTVRAGQRPVELTISTVPVWTAVEDEWHRVAAIGTDGEERFVALFATQRDPLPSPGNHGENRRLRRELQHVTAWGGRLATDARVALLRLSPSGEPMSLVAVDATVASWNGCGGFDIGPRTSAGDLHLNRAGLMRLSLGMEQVSSPTCAE